MDQKETNNLFNDILKDIEFLEVKYELKHGSIAYIGDFIDVCNDPDKVVELIEKKYGLEPGAIKSECREKRVCVARYEAMRNLRSKKMSSTAVGKAVNRDHTSVLYAERNDFKPYKNY